MPTVGEVSGRSTSAAQCQPPPLSIEVGLHVCGLCYGLSSTALWLKKQTTAPTCAVPRAWGYWAGDKTGSGCCGWLHLPAPAESWSRALAHSRARDLGAYAPSIVETQKIAGGDHEDRFLVCWVASGYLIYEPVVLSSSF